MRAKLLMLFGLILMLASVSAVSNPANGITGLTCSYERACAVYTWDAGAAPDFNNFTVSSTDIGADFNTNGTSYTICNISPEDVTTLTVTVHDGNEEGRFSNSIVSSCTVDPGGTIGGGRYFVYNVFVAIGGIIGLVIIVALAIMIMSKMGILKIGSMFGKKQ